MEQLMGSDIYSKPEFLHATLMHGYETSTICITLLSWVEGIEVTFHHGRQRLSGLKDARKTICCNLPLLLEGKQFERGGFVTSPLHYCH